jgi:hypothetical protein
MQSVFLLVKACVNLLLGAFFLSHLWRIFVVRKFKLPESDTADVVSLLFIGNLAMNTAKSLSESTAQLGAEIVRLF